MKTADAPERPTSRGCGKKIRNLSAVLVATFLICGCSTTKFTEYHGTEVFQGKGGGAVSNVDGIDIWEDGDANRNYRIVGLIEQGHGQRLPFGRLFRSFSSPGDRDSTIAKAVRKRGGDAVIVLSGDEDSSGGEDFGRGHHRRHRKYLVVKYAP